MASFVSESVLMLRMTPTLLTPRRFGDFLREIYTQGSKSVPLIALAFVFIGLMLVTEFSFHMKLVLHQDSLVPAFATVLMVRELGPVITVLFMISRVGAGMAAELGAMKTAEQIDALKMIPLHPTMYLAVPRFWAAIISAMILTIIGIGVAVFIGGGLACLRLNYSVGQFFNVVFLYVSAWDFVYALIKAGVFGALMALVALRQGFNSREGSQGVGDSATKTVVYGSVAVIVSDFFLTYLFFR